MGVVSFVRIAIEIQKSRVLATYRQHPGLQHRLPAEDCKVNLTLGLHSGWAIEGAVGSDFKIDPSYVSPNVTLTYGVESASRAYGVSLTLSDSVMEYCTPAMRKNCRVIDTVHMVGSKEPMELFCMDLDFDNVKIDKLPPLGVAWNTRSRFKARQHLDEEKKRWLDSNSCSPAQEFKNDYVIATMRLRYSVDFFQLFNMGYQNYREGEWDVARNMLSGTKACVGHKDGPSSALLRFMESHSFKAPAGWRGAGDPSDADPGHSGARAQPAGPRRGWGRLRRPRGPGSAA